MLLKIRSIDNRYVVRDHLEPPTSLLRFSSTKYIPMTFIDQDYYCSEESLLRARCDFAVGKLVKQEVYLVNEKYKDFYRDYDVPNSNALLNYIINQYGEY